MRIKDLKESYVADAALLELTHPTCVARHRCRVLVLFPFIASDYWLYLACLVAINVASGAGLNVLTGYTGLVAAGPGRLSGPGSLHRGHFANALRHTHAAEPAGRGCGGHAGRASSWHSVAAREGAVPGDCHHCRLVPLRTFCLPTSSSPAARPGCRWPGARAGHGSGRLVSPVLAHRAGDGADAAGRLNLFRAHGRASSPSATATFRRKCWALPCCATSC